MSDSKVFVVYGHNLAARDDLYSFVESLGLGVVRWEDAVAHLPGSPNIHDIVGAGIQLSDAVIILFTPDEFAELRRDFGGDSRRRAQPRPNVIFEAGWAFGAYRDKTIIVQSGATPEVSDLDGISAVRLADVDALKSLARRLEAIVRRKITPRETDWMSHAKYPRLLSNDLPSYWERTDIGEARADWWRVFRAAQNKPEEIYISAGDLYLMGPLLEDVKASADCRNCVATIRVKRLSPRLFEYLTSSDLSPQDCRPKSSSRA